jgi:hypothetical protein
VSGLFLQRDSLAGNQALVFIDNGATFSEAASTANVDLSGHIASTGMFTVGYDLSDTSALEASYFGFGTLRWSEESQLLNQGGDLTVFKDIGFTNDFDGNERVRLYQRSEFNHNVELTFRKELPDCCEWLTVFGGFRYVNVNESFDIRALDGNDESVYAIETGNDLVGLQVGADLMIPICDEVSLEFVGKAGPYANFASHHTFLGDNNNTLTLRGFDTDQVVPAFVGETGLMFVGHLDKAFTIRAGYQAIYMCGLAMAQDQFNLSSQTGPIGTSTSEMATNGSVIFHGAVASITFPWLGEWDLPENLND